jgi:protein-L-isoaspartate(D-aspartate) O-methyltransferase
MTQLLDIQPGQRVLEIGTGSGYQTAILLMLGAEVWTLERYDSLSRQAHATLEMLGLAGERLHHVHGDGTLGWSAGGPYDRIVVTAGAPHLPRAYPQQLASQGRIVIPIGPREGQQLCVFHDQHGTLEKRETIRCQFVPLIGEDGWDASAVTS